MDYNNGRGVPVSSSAPTPSTLLGTEGRPFSLPDERIHVVNPNFEYGLHGIVPRGSIGTGTLPVWPSKLFVQSPPMVPVMREYPPILPNDPIQAHVPYNLPDAEVASSKEEVKDQRINLPEPTSLQVILSKSRDWCNYPINVTTDNFVKFLEHGCIIAERIASMHRPYFNNVHDACLRARRGLIKPRNISASSVSQNTPRVFKDSMYCYIQILNSWNMLKYYVDNLPDSELTSEFKTCFQHWERKSKILTSYLIKIFTELSEYVGDQRRAANLTAPNLDAQHEPTHQVKKPQVEKMHSVSRPAQRMVWNGASSTSDHLLHSEHSTVLLDQAAGQVTTPVTEVGTLETMLRTLNMNAHNAEYDLHSQFVNQYQTGVGQFSSKMVPSTKIPQHAQTLDDNISIRKQACSGTHIREYEQGGLTRNAIQLLQKILNFMESKHVTCYLQHAASFDSFEVPTTIRMVRKKLNTGKYLDVKQLVSDVKRILTSNIYYYELQDDEQALCNVKFFDETFTFVLNNHFSEYNFSHIDGQNGINVGPLVRKPM